MEIFFIRANYLVHMVIFLPWMLLVWLYLNAKNMYDKKRTKRAVQLFFVGVFLAAFAEVLQYWFPYRSFNPMDLLFNVSGVVLGALIFLIKSLHKKTYLSIIN